MSVRLLQRKGVWYIEKDRMRKSLKTSDRQLAEELLAQVERQDRLDIERKLINRVIGHDIKEGKITGIVYFIQAETGGAIKIGYTVDIDKRLRIVQSHSPVPVKVIGTMRGSLEIERTVHDKFVSLRLHGEWFEPDESLLAFIDIHHENIVGDMHRSWKELVEAAGKIAFDLES